MVVYNFKSISVVPSATDVIDIILSMTQRKTPTVVHKGYKISRIRKFYMRKVKYTGENYLERFDVVLNEFPILANIHPFYADLMNVLYSRDHYKLALGQISTAKQTIANITKDYIKLLKFGDSLYRCKELKRAALGRMSTVVKKLQSSLLYLEQVRQHLSRLPSIDPSSRTLLITGYPNVGKSSFVNKISRANVDVQPYAFTTKSLFIGHFDYKYIRWQCIDTPGILDHPLEERNTIEMQAITALAHLHATVLYFIDISEQCGYSIKQQCDLCHNIKPLFANKPLLIVANKTDVRSMSELPEEDRELIQALVREAKKDHSDVKLIEMSNANENGIADVIETGCQQLLQQRVERKLAVSSKTKVDNVLNRLQVAMPTPRDNKQRSVSMPESVIKQRMLRAQQEADAANASDYDDQPDDDAMTDVKKSSYKSLIADEYAKTAHNGISNNPLYKTAKQLENERGGAGVFSFDWRIHWANSLHNPLFAYDVLPEIMDGKNVVDYIDPDIEAKLIELEKEEETLAAECENSLAMMSDDSDLDADERAAVQQIRDTKKLLARHNSLRKSVANKPRVPRTAGVKDVEQAATDLTEMGYEVEKFKQRAESLTRVKQQKRKRSASEALGDSGDGDGDVEMIEGDSAEGGFHKRKFAKVRALVREASRNQGAVSTKAQAAAGSKGMPFRDATQQQMAQKVFEKKQRSRNVHEKTQRLGESDRRFFTKMPKHLFSGKTSVGKRDRR